MRRTKGAYIALSAQSCVLSALQYCLLFGSRGPNESSVTGIACVTVPRKQLLFRCWKHLRSLSGLRAEVVTNTCSRGLPLRLCEQTL